VQLLKTSPKELFAEAKKRSSRVDVDSTANWIVEGPGPRILFVHGFRGDHNGLMPIAGALQTSEVWAPDLPGYGKTPEFDAEHNLATYGTWLRGFVDQAGDFDLILGHSFGSLVVASALNQGLKARTVLLNPITSRATEIGGIGQSLAQRYYNLGAKRPALLSAPIVVRGMSMLLTKSPSPGIRSFAHAQHAQHFSSYRSTRVVVEGFKAASSGSVTDFQGGLQGELLMIAGQQDIVAPVAKTIELHEQLPNSQLEVIPRVGHLTHYETPLAVAMAVERFVKG
jgi:pimeloyl-ACP methyl ester carboxylesterase